MTSSHHAPKALALSALIALSLATHALAAPAYQFTDISLGEYPNVADINNQGQVVGSAYVDVGSNGDVDIEHRGFLYTRGQFQVLGALGSTIDAYGSTNSYSAARALNNAGQIVGESDTASTTYDSRGHAYGRAAFTWSHGQLGPLPNAAPLTPLAINNEGHIVGHTGEIDTYAGIDSRMASIYANGQLTQLTQLGLGSTATGINSRDQVVGTLSIDRFSGLTHAYVYENGQVKDLGTLGGSSSVGSAINEAGQIVGWSDVSGGGSHAFVYDKGNMTDLGLLTGMNNTLGRDINAQGVVVGTAFSGTATETGHAFVYSGGKLQDLNNLVDEQARQGWLLTDAIGINDQGVIIGHALQSGDTRRLFMLTPVPEPEALAMAMAGLLVAGALVQRKTGNRKA